MPQFPLLLHLQDQKFWSCFWVPWWRDWNLRARWGCTGPKVWVQNNQVQSPSNWKGCSWPWLICCWRGPCGPWNSAYTEKWRYRVLGVGSIEWIGFPELGIGHGRTGLDEFIVAMMNLRVSASSWISVLARVSSGVSLSGDQCVWIWVVQTGVQMTWEWELVDVMEFESLGSNSWKCWR